MIRLSVCLTKEFISPLMEPAALLCGGIPVLLVNRGILSGRALSIMVNNNSGKASRCEEKRRDHEQPALNSLERRRTDPQVRPDGVSAAKHAGLIKQPAEQTVEGLLGSI